MKIVNFIKDSTVECSPFSWGITLFSLGCNLQCSMCKGYNFEKVTNKENVVGDVADIIKENITPLHDCVVFLGGEPTIWGEDLVKALEYCHSNNLKTKIFTNGTNPDLVGKINESKLCDSWSVDFKGLTNLKNLIGVEDSVYLKKVDETIRNIMKYELPLEIRTTFHEENEFERNDITKYVKETYVLPYKKENSERYIEYIEQQDVRDIV